MEKITILSKVKHEQPIVIEGIAILPGESTTIKLPVGRLPSDTRIHIVAHIIRAKKPGPVVLLLGGVHGDEINGVEIVRRFVHSNQSFNLEKGTLIAIPLLNVYGFINFSRDVPDGKDVNRSFPGNSSGSLAARVARTLTKKILPFTDIAIDFHTGGASRYNYPQIRYYKQDLIASKLAAAFCAPFTLQKPLIASSFRKICYSLGIPTIVFEGGESVRLDGLSITKGVDGMKRVLFTLGMTKENRIINEESVILTASKWLRAKYSGMFIWTKNSGQKIFRGEPLGEIFDPFGTKAVKVISKEKGYIVGHNNASVVNQGDALFHIGFEK